MTQEEKDLLVKDLCARLPYGIKVLQGGREHILKSIDVYTMSFDCSCAIPKPYLRPMSSMTEGEENEYRAINCYEGLFPRNEDALDYALEHHFDYRGLIPMGLALEAPEGMYKED